MKSYFYCICLLLSLASCQQSEETTDYADLVNPLMGTDSKPSFSHGNTYPAVAVPWGMNFWSPQTGEDGSGWMYTYDKHSICGFRQTHQPSPWINDYGTFSIMPIIGDLRIDEGSRKAEFSHENESATPYYYQVQFDNGIQTAYSATTRGAIFEISFPKDQDQYVIVDGYKGHGSLSINPSEKSVTGISTYNNGGVTDNFGNHYYMTFSHPVIGFGVTHNDTILENRKKVSSEHAGAYLKFDVPKGEKLVVKVASSFITNQQAVLNFNREVASYNLDDIRNKAHDLWNQKLGRIEVEGESKQQQQTFYSSLYRALLFPRTFFEYNEQGEPVYYSPYDGQVHKGYFYTDNGFWDTFRSVHPLFTLVYPEISDKVVQSIIQTYQQSGFLPEWSSPGHRDCMIGNNSISILTDAWLKGIKPSDPEEMLSAMLYSVNHQDEHISSIGRDGYKYYNQLGYVPYPEVKEATAKTLEYAYADWCLARFAESIGHQDVAKQYYKSAQNYRNMFNPEHKFMWSKNAKGQWAVPFSATQWGGAFTEGSSWHWTWSVLHDVEGLSDLLGGETNTVALLDSMFVAPNTYEYGTYGQEIHEMAEMAALNMGQYAHGNQPVQHAAYLYDYLGQPWKTQYHVRDIMNKLYQPTSDGYCGDEDNGQTSAWYVFSAMGFYPVSPGTSQYVMGSPLFEKVTLHLPNNKTFSVVAKDNSAKNVYIKQAVLNEKSIDKNYLTHRQLIQGGVLECQMDSVPNRSRGINKVDFPYSYTK